MQAVVAWGRQEVVGQAVPKEVVGPMDHHQGEPKVVVAKAQDERGSHRDLEVAMETARALEEVAMPMVGEVVRFRPLEHREVAMVPLLCRRVLYRDCHAVLVSATWHAASGILDRPSYL